MATTITGSGVNNIVDGTITNADINASAAIAGSKLSGAGKVLQVVSASTSGDISTTSSGFQATGLVVSITPLNTSSKLFVSCSGFCLHINTGANNKGGKVSLYSQTASGGYANVDGSNTILTCYGDGLTSWVDLPCSFQTQFTPTYTIGQQIDIQPYYGIGNNSSGGFYFNHTGGNNSAGTITLTVMEIG